MLYSLKVALFWVGCGHSFRYLLIFGPLLGPCGHRIRHSLIFVPF
ncbi:hypothetical protein GYMC10_0234 [Paenibacillus sp. Y412MC10]|nr:hypothetical protein GYMC10_0234 [Paenibacillus sp. Y412MC10]